MKKSHSKCPLCTELKNLLKVMRHHRLAAEGTSTLCWALLVDLRLGRKSHKVINDSNSLFLLKEFLKGILCQEAPHTQPALQSHCQKHRFAPMSGRMKMGGSYTDKETDHPLPSLSCSQLSGKELSTQIRRMYSRGPPPPVMDQYQSCSMLGTRPHSGRYYLKFMLLSCSFSFLHETFISLFRFWS